MNPNLIDQKYWDDNYKNYEFNVAPKDDQLRQWIERFFKLARDTRSCFEVGCFPGRYLAVFGELGYELCGVDLTPRVETDLPLWLKNQGYKIGKFYRADFLTAYDEGIKYDIACSFGFLEHFVNWEDVLVKQSDTVKSGVYLVVVAPNFRGFVQKPLHFLLDKTSYRQHNTSSMNPELWSRIIESLGFETIYSGYFGAFEFWVDNEDRGIIQKAILKAVMSLSKVMKMLPRDKMAYSPFCGLVARKL